MSRTRFVRDYDDYRPAVEMACYDDDPLFRPLLKALRQYAGWALLGLGIGAGFGLLLALIVALI